MRCCAGFRVGWAALPPPLARKLEKALFASCLGPTPFSQVPFVLPSTASQTSRLDRAAQSVWVGVQPWLLACNSRHNLLPGLRVTARACGGGQVILSQLLQHWGDAGLEAHVRRTQQEYWRRASALHEAATQV